MGLSSRQQLGYLKHIDVDPSVSIDPEGLRELVTRHLCVVPFENVTVLLEGTPKLDLDALYEKIVERGRGGYCFELNTLFAALLASLGFRFDRLMARVRYRNPNPVPPLSHKTLRVWFGSRSYLADVGFGGNCPVAPMEIPEVGRESCAGPFRLQHPQPSDEDNIAEVRLQARLDGEWETVYEFPLYAFRAHDYAYPNYCVANMATSVFTRYLRCGRMRADGSATSLLNDSLAIMRPDLRHDRVDLSQLGPIPQRDPESFSQLLIDELGLRLSAPECEALLQWLRGQPRDAA